jgi:hypothetical protein
MDWLKSVLFEDPLPGCIVLAMVEVVVVLLWWRSRQRKWLYALLAPPLLAAALVTTAALVKTDREQIIEAAAAIAADVAAGREDSLQLYLDESFRGRYEGIVLTKADAVQICTRERNRYKVQVIDIKEPVVEVSGARATMGLLARMTADVPVAGQVTVNINFSLDWIKRPSGWRIREAAEPRVPLR